MSIFDKYAASVDQAELEASQKEIDENAQGGQREEVPFGNYEVKVDRMEAKNSKSGNPMVSIWFRILNGKFENSIIFYNGVFHEDWMRHRVVKMICAILDDYSNEAMVILKSNDLDEINNFLFDVHEEIDGKFEYLLKYGERKGYGTYEIEEVYEA